MNKRTLFLGLLWGIGLYSPTLQAQSFTDHAWKSPMPVAPAIPAEHQNAKAVIFKSETFSKGEFSGEFPYSLEQLGIYRTYMHLKIQSEEALKDYKRVAVSRFKGQIGDYVQMKEYDIRVRKKDGTVKDLTIKDLPKPTLTEDDELYDSREDLYIYEIPDLAIGDELEIISVIESKFLDNGRIVNLYQEYPTLEAKFIISVPSNVGLKGEQYNGMPKVDIKSQGEQRVYTWTMNNLKAIPEANASGSIFTKKLEYFIYELNFDAFRPGGASFSPKNYRDLGIQYFEDYMTIRINKQKRLDEFYTKLFEGQTEFVDKLVSMNEFVTKKLKIINPRDLDKKDGLDDYVTNLKTDYAGVSKLYYDFFKREGVKVYLAFGKDRFDGDFDLAFVSNSQVADYFFIVEDKTGATYTVMGLNGINEISAGLAGQPVYLINLTDRSKKDLESLTFPDAGLKSLEDNKQLSKNMLEIKLADNSATLKNTTQMSGYYATNSRGGMVSAHKADTLVKFLQRANENGHKENSIQVTEATLKQFEVLPPYPFIGTYTMTLKNLLKPKETNTWEFDIEDWVGNSLRRVRNAEARILDYYVPFAGSDVDDWYLIFDKEVTIANMADYNQKIDNEFVTYESKITQLKPNTIRLESRYTVKQLFIPKEKVGELDKANKAAEKMYKTKLQIKAK